MEAAPKADELGLPRIGLRQSKSAFHGFGATGIKLGTAQITGRDLGDELDQLRSMSTRETADVHLRDLLRDRAHELGMGVAEAGDADAGEEVDVAAAVDVDERRAL